MIEAPTSKSFAGRRVDAGRDARRLRASPVTWLNLVCLDAPLVAISWQWMFARSFGVAASWGATAALFLTAWLIYLADRLADSLSVDVSRSTSLRQRFCRRHRNVWMAAIACISGGNCAVIFFLLHGSQLVLGAVIGLCAIVYLAVNRLRPQVWRVVPLKEMSIGFVFAGGVIVPLASGLTSLIREVWLPFACLCALNCISIAAWERYLDTAQQRISIATTFPRVGGLARIAVALLALASGWRAWDSAQPQLYACIASSAALLLLLHFFPTRTSQDVRTALADVALLTPLVVLVFR